MDQNPDNPGTEIPIPELTLNNNGCEPFRIVKKLEMFVSKSHLDYLAILKNIKFDSREKINRL